MGRDVGRVEGRDVGRLRGGEIEGRFRAGVGAFRCVLLLVPVEEDFLRLLLTLDEILFLAIGFSPFLTMSVDSKRQYLTTGSGLRCTETFLGCKREF